MKKTGLFSVLILVLTFAFSALGYAQLREELPKSTDYAGPIIKTQTTNAVGNWADILNVKMSHSYSMNFASIGGQYQNINAYTNHMQFMFSDRLTGYLDLSILHSPFGNSFLNNGAGDPGAKFIIRNAELNYQIGENSSLSIQFQQNPFYGISPWSNFYRNPFDHRNY